MNAKRLATFLLVAAWAPFGCDRIFARADFERMIDQPYREPYESSALFPDGRAMRHPPPGTVALGQVPVELPPTRGLANDEVLQEIPVAVDRALLQRGRDRFERFCAACHGSAGYGNPAIVENAELRPPPSLHEPDIVAQPPGRVFQTVTWGYGLMPSYRAQLTVRDRWAVIAYLQVLQASQAVALAELPAAYRQRAAAALDEAGAGSP